MNKKPSKDGLTKPSTKNKNHQKNTAQSARKIFTAFILNLVFSVIEFLGGFFTNSIAITSDAIHDFGDALSIGIAYFLERYSKKAPDDKYTYGYIRYSVLGSLLTTVILITGSIIVIISAVSRTIQPEPIDYNGMIILAIFGVIINFAAVYFTRDGDSLNQKSVNLHMLEDVLGWVVVLIGAVIMRFTNIELLDPILSIGVAIFILVNALRNLKEVVDLFLEKTPHSISIDQLRQHLLGLDGIKDVHHIHVWSMDGFNNYATLHVVCDQPTHQLKDLVRSELQEHNIAHVTIELETSGEHCSQEQCQTNHTHVSAHAHHHHH